MLLNNIFKYTSLQFIMESLYLLYQYLINNCCCKHLLMKINNNEYDLDRLSKYTQHQIGRQRNIVSRIILELEKTQNEIISLNEGSYDDIELMKSKNKMNNLYNLLHNYSCNNLFIDEEFTSCEMPSRSVSTNTKKVLNSKVIIVGQRKS